MLQVTKPSSGASAVRRTGPSAPAGPLPPIVTGNEIPPVPAYRNCVGCGFVYTLEEFEKRSECGFCGRPLSSKSRKENRRRREEGEDEEGLLKAIALKDRLVRYDRESSARTRVTDDDQA